MSMRQSFAALAGALLLAGCVTAPTGPAVMALPGTTKSFDQFQADDVACRDFAHYALGPSERVASDTAAANAVGGAALGAASGAIIGSASGSAGPGAAIGAGAGLLFGSIAGANSAGFSNYAMQQRYDMAYLHCMYAKGNQVPLWAARRYGPPQYAPQPAGPSPYGPPPDWTPPVGTPAG